MSGEELVAQYGLGKKAAPEIRAIGFNVTANLGGARQIVIQDFVSSDLSPTEANARVDFVMKIADRQAARYEIVELRKEKDEMDRSLAQYEIDRAAVDHAFERAQAQLDVQILELRAKHQEVFDKGYADHVARGKQGAYRPAGNQAQALAAMEAGADAVKREKEKNAAERDVAVQNLEQSITARKTRAAVNAERIAELQALIDGS